MFSCLSPQWIIGMNMLGMYNHAHLASECHGLLISSFMGVCVYIGMLLISSFMEVCVYI